MIAYPFAGAAPPHPYLVCVDATVQGTPVQKFAAAIRNPKVHLLNSFLMSKIHSLPCDVQFRGSTDVSENFEISTQKGSSSSRLRGRLLKGASVDLPSGFVGCVLRVAPASSVVDVLAVGSDFTSGQNKIASAAAPKSPKRGRGWLLADNDDDEDDPFAKHFLAEEERGRVDQETPKSKISHDSDFTRVSSLPSIPSNGTVFPLPNTSSFTSSQLADCCRSAVVASPSCFRDGSGSLRSVSKCNDMSISNTFDRYTVWEHDHVPSSVDVVGPLAWIHISELIHRVIEDPI